MIIKNKDNFKMRERESPSPLSTLLWEKRLWQGELGFWGSDPFYLSGKRRQLPRAVCTCRYMCGVVFLCMCTSICVCLCVYINLWYIWIPVYMNMCAWACTCVYVCVHKCVLAHACKLRNVTCYVLWRNPEWVDSWFSLHLAFFLLLLHLALLCQGFLIG